MALAMWITTTSQAVWWHCMLESSAEVFSTEG